jgi:SAM-dependent methyltransferase
MEALNSDIFRRINCPICDNNSFKVVIKFTPEQFLNEERKKYYNLKSLGIDRDTNFYIKKCKKCGFVFVNPRLRSDLYSIVYNEAKEGQYENKEWAYEAGDLGSLYNLHHKYRESFLFLTTLLYFKKYFEKPKNDGYKRLRLLDYGCGYGHTLELCKVFGIDGVGVEIDQKRLDFCKKKDLNVKFPSELPESEKFHIVISSSVIEHIDDLDFYFKYISDRIVKNGIFSFNGLTPKMIDIEKKRNFFKNVMPLEHINYFTRESLLRIAKKYCFFETGKLCSVSAVEKPIDCVFPFFKKTIFKGFYPTGRFDMDLIKK